MLLDTTKIEVIRIKEDTIKIILNANILDKLLELELKDII